MFKKYSSTLCDMDTLGETLEEINEKKLEIETVFYVTDTNQVCIIYKESVNPLIDMLRKERDMMGED